MGRRTHPVTGIKGNLHRGIDIASAKGTPLTANVAGKVIASGNAKSMGYDSSYGNIVVVQAADGTRHLYAHLDSASAKVGSQVTKGTVMGKVGSTGRSTGPHVHYEVTKDGGLHDPKRYL
jgi:murein DD-endopeptidase MepM/ murein hydrolase activator NlpD